MPLIMFVPKKLSFQEFFQTLRHRNTEPDSYNHKRRPLHKKQRPGCRYLPTKQMLFLTISFLLTSQYACRLLTPLNDDPIDRLKLLVIQVLRIPKRIVGCRHFKNPPLNAIIQSAVRVCQRLHTLMSTTHAAHICFPYTSPKTISKKSWNEI